VFGEVTFERFQDSDAQQVADLLNRNKFHAARNCHMTAENYLFTQRSRSVCFSIVAKKNGKIIGIAGAYHTSDQHVAKKHQIFVGTFLVDLQYRLSYSIIMGLYDGLMRGIAEHDFKEILSGVRPQNSGAYHLTLKCGFVLLDNTPNDFGRISLHNFAPALSKYAGAESTEVSSNTFFSILPVVDKKEARMMQGKQLLGGRCIEVDYKLGEQDVTLLFDIVNFKVDGATVPKQMRIYPDFDTQGKYVIENLNNSKTLSTSIELVMMPGSGLSNIVQDIVLEPGQTKAIECSTEVSELKFVYADAWYRLHPHLLEDIEVTKEPVRFSYGKLLALLDPSTGFLSIMDGEQKLATLVWPCAVIPYVEGVFTPRIKDLRVEQHDNCLTVTEETDSYILTRKCLFSENKIDVTTTLKCKTEAVTVRPISQVYAHKGVQGYTLKSEEKEMDFGASAIKHEGYEYSDYTYWDTEPERFSDFPIQEVSLKYLPATVEIVIDKKCKPVIHAPMFTSTLDFNMENILEEQVVEKMEVYYRPEEI